MNVKFSETKFINVNKKNIKFNIYWLLIYNTRKRKSKAIGTRVDILIKNMLLKIFGCRSCFPIILQWLRLPLSLTATHIRQIYNYEW